MSQIFFFKLFFVFFGLMLAKKKVVVKRMRDMEMESLEKGVEESKRNWGEMAVERGERKA